MNDEYRTVASPMTAKAVVQRSIFLAHVREVNSEGAARGMITAIKDEHRQATHHCYAFRLGMPGEETYYFDDDGEPHGTAGKPIYGAILNREITNVLVVVIRYFGGKKLGVRGLIESYGGVAQDVIDQAGIVTRVFTEELDIRCDYTQVNGVLNQVNRWSAEVVANRYTEDVRLTVKVRRRDAGEFLAAIQAVPGPIVIERCQ